jgi:phosphoglycerate dehydrogenase-like enzyme
MTTPFRVGVTPDAYAADGHLLFDFGLLDDAPNIEWELIADGNQELAAELAAQFDAIVVATSGISITRTTLKDAERLMLVARLGAGYESIDVEACTESGVIVTTAPDAVRRPMATAAIAFLLALTLKIPQKDRFTREGRWADGVSNLGVGLVGRTFGIIGLGSIGREIVRLAEPLSMRFLAFDPYVDPSTTRDGTPVQMVGIEELLTRSDMVCVTCPLTPETRRLLNHERLSLMKRSAYLINIARGAIVDQEALVSMLREGRLAGAALDVFDQEPIDPRDPLLELENVILTPHAIGWTDEIGILGGTSGSKAVLAVAGGGVPEFVINPAVLNRPGFMAKHRRHGNSALISDENAPFESTTRDGETAPGQRAV